MAKFNYNDLSVSYMLLCMAKQRNAFTTEELPGVDECIIKLYELLEEIKKDIESRTATFDDLEPTEDQQAATRSTYLVRVLASGLICGFRGIMPGCAGPGDPEELLLITVVPPAFCSAAMSRLATL